MTNNTTTDGESESVRTEKLETIYLTVHEDVHGIEHLLQPYFDENKAIDVCQTLNSDAQADGTFNGKFVVSEYQRVTRDVDRGDTDE